MKITIIFLSFGIFVGKCVVGYKNEHGLEYCCEDDSNIQTYKAYNRNHDEIYRPCELDDIKCIRKEMAENSGCDPRVFGSVPDPISVPHFRFQAPYFNASFYDQYLLIKNLRKCVITSFHTNLTSDTTVFGMECPDITFEANRTVILHRQQDQDVLYRYRVFMTYHALGIIINLRPSKLLDICGTRAYGFVSKLKSLKALPYDKATEEFIRCDSIGIFRRDRTIYDREVALYAVNMYLRLYINNNICNFGCKSLFKCDDDY